MKTKFTATFSNGQTINRNSDHAYAFAWAVIRKTDGKIEDSGFSSDRANAAKGAAAKLWKGVSARDLKNIALRRYHVKMAKERGFASSDAMYAHWEAEAVAHNAGRTVEIVAL